MKLSRKIIIPVLLILILVIGFALVNRGAPAAEEGDSLQLVSQTPAQETTADATKSGTATPTQSAAQSGITEDGTYDSKAEVAEYIHTYGHLPSNYITKREAEALGWNGGSLKDVAPGKWYSEAVAWAAESGIAPDLARGWTRSAEMNRAAHQALLPHVRAFVSDTSIPTAKREAVKKGCSCWGRILHSWFLIS